MATRSPFLVRALRILAILLSIISLLVPAGALPPSGGGHSGGGHFGGGHSGGGHSSGRHSAGNHAGGHFGWLHFGLGKHSARHAEFAASATSNTVPRLAWGTSPRQPEGRPFRGLRQRFSGLRRYSKPARTVEFLSLFLTCAGIILVSSATGFRAFLPPDASSTA